MRASGPAQSCHAIAPGLWRSIAATEMNKLSALKTEDERIIETLREARLACNCKQGAWREQLGAGPGALRAWYRRLLFWVRAVRCLLAVHLHHGHRARDWQEVADSWKISQQSRIQEATAKKLTKALKMEVNKMKYEVNRLHSELRSVKRELEEERQKNKKGWEMDGSLKRAQGELSSKGFVRLCCVFAPCAMPSAPRLLAPGSRCAGPRQPCAPEAMALSECPRRSCAPAQLLLRGAAAAAAGHPGHWHVCRPPDRRAQGNQGKQRPHTMHNLRPPGASAGECPHATAISPVPRCAPACLFWPLARSCCA